MNPQMLFPHALDGFRHRLLNFAGCSHQLQPGKTLPAGKTGLGQQGTRFLRIELHPMRRLVSGAVRRKAEARLAAAAHHVPHQSLPVYRQGKGPPDPGVIQRRTRRIQTVKNSHVIIILAKIIAAALPGVSRHLRRHVVGDMKLAVEKHAGFRKAVHGGKKTDSIQPDGGSVPVPGIAAHLHIIIETVLRHKKRSVPYGRSGPRPFPRPVQHAAVGFHGMAGNRKPGAVKQQQGKLGHRRTQLHLQGIIIRGAHAHAGFLP